MPATSVEMSAVALEPSDVAVAASTALRATLTGPPQRATVIGAPAGAVYLRAANGELIAVLASDAARLPLGAVVGNRDALRTTPRPGHEGLVGDGRIDAGALSAYVVRWWDSRVALPPLRPDLLAANLALLPGPGHVTGTGLPAQAQGETLPRLATALRAADTGTVAEQAKGLIGLGSGLTPAGDDVLVGLLSALVCLGHPQSRTIADAVQAAAAERTTDLSLALLRHAGQGNCIGAVGSFLRALAGVGDLATAHRRLLAVGHSSGPALCVGVRLGADSVARLSVQR